MRTAFSAKVFFYCLMITTLLLLYMSLKDFSKQYATAPIYRNLQEDILKNFTETKLRNAKNATVHKIEQKPVMKYILQWTSPRNVPFVYMGQGQQGFTSRHCPHTNCIVTSNRSFLADIRQFDVVAFCGPEVLRMPNTFLPNTRSLHQKYVFASIESSHYYPVCSNRFDGFFNWTWTFRLDSEVRWGYMMIKDQKNNTIGPNKIMHWMKVEDMDPVSPEFIKRLQTKKKAAAWFVSNCYDKSNRMRFALNLKSELKKYNLGLDIYGQCGRLKCPREKQDECDKMLDKNYYFYLSFENSFSEDYVTEKLLHALRNNVVPIVYGGANYTRFMPDGIYLNARELGVEKLAKKMSELINDKEQYSNYFKWKKYYSYHGLHESPETDEYCRFCAILNDEEKVKTTSIVENFRDWWDSPKFC